MVILQTIQKSGKPPTIHQLLFRMPTGQDSKSIRRLSEGEVGRSNID